MAYYHRRKKRTVNAQLVQIENVLSTVASWAELNIQMVLRGVEMNDDIMMILISNSFWDGYVVADVQLQIVKNSYEILTEIVEDISVEISDTVFDMLIKKLMFSRTVTSSAFEFINKESIKRIFIALAKRNPALTKSCYDKYSKMLKYKF